MMKATKLAVILISAGLTVGCASKGDITSLQGQIDGLKADVSSAKSTASEALETAQQANATAKAADATARRAANEIDAKLGTAFKKKMVK